jgi:hypothetical protein
MADRERDIRKFRLAAQQRLAAAEFLLEHGFHLDAIYLAGYGVECALKYLIVKRTPHNLHASMMHKLTEVGAKGHNFDYLKLLLQRKPLNLFLPSKGGLAKMFRDVTWWSSTLRYEVMTVDYDQARRIVDAAKGIRDWTERS